jgi:hypothetical protein
MKTPWKYNLFSHKVVAPKCYNSNPYRPFASFQYVMAVWNWKVYNVKKSEAYIQTIRSILVNSQYFNLNFMKMIVEKKCSFSTLPKTTTIVSSTSLKYLKILSFTITLKIYLFHIWMVGLQSCKGFMPASLLDYMVVIKKLDCCSSNKWSNEPACDLAFGLVNIWQQ